VERCCAVQGNYCRSSPDLCTDNTASNDYLYRLSPGEPERYEPIPGGNTDYQFVDPTYWPQFGGNDDLRIGWATDGRTVVSPGTNSYCDQGHTYRGSPDAACGGNYGNWGHTDLEVWFI
jgi:hypothetical protein